jgi:hypothetical protein
MGQHANSVSAEVADKLRAPGEGAGSWGWCG